MPDTATASSPSDAVQLLTGSGEVLINAREPAFSTWLARATPAPVAVSGLALVFAYPWLALAIVLTASVLVAAAMWWLYRWLRRRPA